jgi:glycosyltransferase involved in cell wall biosynthesis
MVANVPSMLREFFLPHLDHLKTAGWQVDALVGPRRTAADDGIDASGFGQVHRVGWTRGPFHPRNLLSVPGEVRKIVESGEYDLVHVHTPVAGFVTRMALRGMRRRPAVVYTAHGFHFHAGGSRVANAMFILLERLAGRWTDILIVINREDEVAARHHRLVPSRRLVRMAGVGLDLASYNPRRISAAAITDLRNELGIAPESSIFLMIAEYNVGKRHRDAIAAIALPPDRDFVLLLAGVGPLEAETRALAEQLGVARRVRFLGYRHDIPTLIKAADALVLPSEREGLPRAVLEALAMGTPVVSTRIRGVAELLEDGRGFMADVGDVSGLRTALDRVLDDRAGAREVALRGRAFAQAFDVREVLRHQDEVYAAALSIRARRARAEP